MVRRIAFAFLSGAGFTALLPLMLHLSYMSLLVSLLLLPGGMIQALLGGTDSPVAILLSNFAIYSLLTFAIVSRLPQILQRPESPRVILWLALPVGFLVGLACIPALDPLWPTGMTQLAKREAQLQEILPVGMDLEQAQGVLRSQGIEFWEHIQESDGKLTWPEGSLNASSGDIILSAQIPTDAGQFPCGYRIDVFLAFSKDRRLTDRYIHRFRICP
jgi:hypothetical protein